MQLKSMIRFYICPMRPPRIHHVYLVSPNRYCSKWDTAERFQEITERLGRWAGCVLLESEGAVYFCSRQLLSPIDMYFECFSVVLPSQAIPKSIFVSVGLFASPILRGGCVQRMLGGAGTPTFYEMPQVAPEII